MTQMRSATTNAGCTGVFLAGTWPGHSDRYREGEAWSAVNIPGTSVGHRDSDRMPAVK